MEQTDLQQLWQSIDRHLLEARVLNLQSWALNFRSFEMLQHQKMKKGLYRLILFKSFAVILGICWVAFLGLLVWSVGTANLFFSCSVMMILLFTVYAIYIYLRHIRMITTIRYDAPVADVQEKIAILQASTFRATRVLWLQMPFYSTWCWNSKWIKEGPYGFWLIAVPIALFFLWLSIYLYRNLIPGNMHKKWVNLLMMVGPEYKKLAEASGYLEEIRSYRDDLG